MNRLRSKLVQMSPKSKQICVVVGAAAALFFVIWLFQGEPEKRIVYDKKKDQVANVLTDRSNRNVGLDRMAGQIRRLDKQNEEVVRDLNSLKASLEDLKKDRTLLEMRKQIEALSGQFAGLETEQRRAVEALDEASKNIRPKRPTRSRPRTKRRIGRAKATAPRFQTVCVQTERSTRASA